MCGQQARCIGVHAAHLVSEQRHRGKQPALDNSRPERQPVTSDTRSRLPRCLTPSLRFCNRDWLLALTPPVRCTQAPTPVATSHCLFHLCLLLRCCHSHLLHHSSHQLSPPCNRARLHPPSHLLHHSPHQLCPPSNRALCQCRYAAALACLTTCPTSSPHRTSEPTADGTRSTTTSSSLPAQAF